MLLIAHCCLATNFSFTGAFTSDTDVQLFYFTVNAPTSGVLLRTWSYGGGVNSAGATIASGGFEPAFAPFYYFGGQWLAMNPLSGGPCVADQNPDPLTGVCFDVYYPTTVSFPAGEWAPGEYALALLEYGNFLAGSELADGFTRPPPGNFTCAENQGSPPNFPVDDPFCDLFGNQRDGHWAVDIIGVDSATQAADTPEPAAVALVGLGLAVFICARRVMVSR